MPTTPPAINYAEADPFALTKKDWSIEFYQREQISQGLKNAQSEDLIIISDLDEFYSNTLSEPCIKESRLSQRRIFGEKCYENF